MAHKTVDIEELRRRRENLRPPPQTGGFEKVEWFRPEQKGHYYLYIAPPCAQAQPWIGTAVDVHYKIGEKERTVVCLGEENEALWGENGALLDAIEKRNERLHDAHPDWEVVFDDVSKEIPACPACEWVRSSGDESVARNSGATRVYYFNVALIKFVPESGGTEMLTPASKMKFLAWSAKTAIGDKILDFITVDGIDISDPNRASLVKFSKLSRGGKVKGTSFDVKYEVALDPRTSQKPMVLPPPLVSQLPKLEEGGTNYIYDIIAGQVAGHAALRETLGVDAPDAESYEEESDADVPPSCYEQSCDVTNQFCKDCPFKGPCAVACGVKWPNVSPAARSNAPPPTPQPSGRPAPSSVSRPSAASREAPPPMEEEPPPVGNDYGVDDEAARMLDAEIDSLMEQAGASNGRESKPAAAPATRPGASPAPSASGSVRRPGPAPSSGSVARPRPTGQRA